MAESLSPRPVAPSPTFLDRSPSDDYDSDEEIDYYNYNLDGTQPRQPHHRQQPSGGAVTPAGQFDAVGSMYKRRGGLGRNAGEKSW